MIIATDKTQLTQFSGNKSAYPVYLTIGNLPKSIRRKPSKHACVLIAYLSVDKVSRRELTAQQHRSRVQRTFHESMKHILAPLKDAGKTGVDMTGADGCVRKVFPILSCYVADYPEQCLVTCAKSTTCPKCQVPSDELGDSTPSSPRTPTWTTGVINNAKATETTAAGFHTSCMSQNVSGGVYSPFWEGFPLCDIHRSITPDVLHQLYQGTFKHIVAWCQRLLQPEELDRRIRSLPTGYGLRHFKNGISALSQLSGSERKNIAKILLGCLIGKIPNNGLRAIRASLDFIYLAQYSTHDDDTLGYLEKALQEFHQYKSYFVETGVRENFNIPKFHSLMHYIECIKLFGTTDNYNTEMFERLHIDFAKEGWRASNQRDEFPQMIEWLSRQEKLVRLERTIYKRIPASNPSPTVSMAQTSKQPVVSIAKNPNYPNRLISTIESTHKAPGFSSRLKEFLNLYLERRTSNRRATEHPLPFAKLDVFNMFRFHPPSLDDNELDETNIVKAIPQSKKLKEGHFDTVVILNTDKAESTALAGSPSKY